MAAIISCDSSLDIAKSLCYQLLPFMFDYRRGSTESQDTEQCCVIVFTSALSDGC